MTPPPALWAKGSAELGLPPPPSSKVPPWLPCEVATKKKPCGLEAFSGLASPEVRRLPLPLLSCVRRSWVGSWNFYNHSEVTKPPDSVVLGQAHGAQLPRPSPPPRQGDPEIPFFPRNKEAALQPNVPKASWVGNLSFYPTLTKWHPPFPNLCSSEEAC